MNVRSLSIVICTYNRASFLRETLYACRKMNRPIDCDIELLVVDNNSNDYTRLVIEQVAKTSPFADRKSVV